MTEPSRGTGETPRDAEIARIAAVLGKADCYWTVDHQPQIDVAALYDAGLRLDRDRAAVPDLDVEHAERLVTEYERLAASEDRAAGAKHGEDR